MANPEGTPIWYELMTADPAASKAFYDDVIGWTVDAQPSGEQAYRMIDSGNGGGMVGGVMRLTDEMQSHGANFSLLYTAAANIVTLSLHNALPIMGSCP